VTIATMTCQILIISYLLAQL